MKNILIISLLLYAARAMSMPLDSIGSKRINGRLFIQHRIEAKQTFYAIAKQYNISLDSLMVVNQQIKAAIKGKILLIPVAEKPQTDSSSIRVDQAHANADAASTATVLKHKVSKGETVAMISKKYEISPTDLVKWNGIRDNRIDAGQMLIVHAMGVWPPFKPWNRPAVKQDHDTIAPISITVDRINESGICLLVNDPKGAMIRAEAEGGFVAITSRLTGHQIVIPVTKGNPELFKDNAILILDRHTASQLETLSGSDRILVDISYLSIP